MHTLNAKTDNDQSFDYSMLFVVSISVAVNLNMTRTSTPKNSIEFMYISMN